MQFTLRRLLMLLTLVAILFGLLAYVTKDYRKRLAMRAHLLSIGAYSVRITSDNSISAAFHDPIESSNIVRYKQIAALDFKEAHVTPQSLDNLAGLESVGVIVFSLSNVREEDLLRLQKIGSVRAMLLSHTKLTDDAVEAIAAVPGLEIVDLTDTQITPEGIDRLKKLKPSLDVRVRN